MPRRRLVQAIFIHFHEFARPARPSLDPRNRGRRGSEPRFSGTFHKTKLCRFSQMGHCDPAHPLVHVFITTWRSRKVSGSEPWGVRPVRGEEPPLAWSAVARQQSWRRSLVESLPRRPSTQGNDYARSWTSSSQAHLRQSQSASLRHRGSLLWSFELADGGSSKFNSQDAQRTSTLNFWKSTFDRATFAVMTRSDPSFSTWSKELQVPQGRLCGR